MSTFNRLATRLLLTLVFCTVFVHVIPAGAQESRRHGFRVDGYFYPDVQIPMTYYEKKIFDRLADVVDRSARHKSDHTPSGLSRGTLKSVKLNPGKSWLLVNLDKAIMFREGPDGMEDFLHILSMNALLAAKQVLGKHVDVKYVYDGEVFGYGRPPPGIKYNALPSETGVQTAAPTGGTTKGARDKVVVSASHGLFRELDTSGNFVRWRFARSSLNGIIEDTLTPDYADELVALLNSPRYNMLTELARNNTQLPYVPPKGTDYTDPSEVWRSMGARYHLQSILPKKPAIWASSGRDQEEGQDRRARPYYANSIRADGLISLHSNGITNPPSEDGTATGGLVIYSTIGLPSNAVLAEQIACSMREIVRKTTVYTSYDVQPFNGTDNYGEVDLATMPSVLVELAFHDNRSDAAMLLDPSFRAAAVRGIARGWDLYRKGKTCAPLELHSVSNIDGFANTRLYGSATYSGNGPFSMISELVSCPIYPINYYCPESWVHELSNITASSFDFMWWCNHVPSNLPRVTSYHKAYLVDQDGVKTDKIDWNFPCGGAGSPEYVSSPPPK